MIRRIQFHGFLFLAAFYVGFFACVPRADAAVCLAIDSRGNVYQQTGVTASSCAGIVALEPTEYQQIISSVSEMPDPATAASIWAAFFGLVLACYYCAKPVGALLHFLRDS